MKRLPIPLGIGGFAYAFRLVVKLLPLPAIEPPQTLRLCVRLNFQNVKKGLTVAVSPCVTSVDFVDDYRRNASCKPPSTLMICPVVLLERFEAKKYNASAWSAGVIGDLVNVRWA